MLPEGFRLRQALADLLRAAGGDCATQDPHAAFDNATPPDQLWASVACMLWQSLAGKTPDPFLKDAWDQRLADLQAGPAPIRAALINGFERLRCLGLLDDRCRPEAKGRVTHPRASVEAALQTVARAMTPSETDHIASADYGKNVVRHRDVLVALLADPAVAYRPGEFCFPAEVVELLAHVPRLPG